MAAYKSQGQFFRGDFIYLIRIGLVDTGITIYFIKVIDAEIVPGGFVFYDIVFSKYPPDRFFDLNILQSDPQGGAKGGMPL